MKTITWLALVVGAPTLMTVGCRDATGPGSLRVSITAVSTDGPLGVLDASGSQWLVGCDAGLMLRVTGRDDEGVRWTGASLDFSGGAGGTVAFDAAELASLFGGPDLGPGEERYVAVRFMAPEPFRLAGRFRYVPMGGGRERTAEYTQECVPPGGVVTGTYVLRTINDVPLPAPSENFTVEYDTLRFFPNMTYTLSVDVVESTPSRAGPEPYRIPSADILNLGAIGPGTAAAEGSVRRAPGWLIYTETRPGRPTFVWRFEKVQ